MSQGPLWITGATGFVGGYLLRRLRRERIPAVVLGFDPHHVPADFAAVYLNLAEAAKAAPGQPVLELAPFVEPRGLLHLAAISHVVECEQKPALAEAVNVLGPQRFYEQLLARWPQLPILHVSSGYVYRTQAGRLREEQPVEPVNVYGATKLRGEAVAMGLRARGHRVTVVRPFNHTGAGQEARFVLPSFALRLAALERQGGGELAVGNLDSVRDFLHVDQVLDAYLELLPQAGALDLVNICSGAGQRIGDLLDGLRARVAAPVAVKTDPGRLRGSADADRLVGDPERLQRLLGRPLHLDREALLDELLADARARVAAGESLVQA